MSATAATLLRFRFEGVLLCLDERPCPADAPRTDADRSLPLRALLREPLAARCVPAADGPGARGWWRIVWELGPTAPGVSPGLLPEVRLHPGAATGTVTLPERFPAALISALLRHWALPAHLELQGWTVLHAACVRLAEGAVLLAGGTGAGKSTLTAWLTAGGGTLISDDFVALRPAKGLTALGPDPVLRLRPDAWRRIGPRLPHYVWARDPGGKVEGRPDGRPHPEVSPPRPPPVQTERLAAVVFLDADRPRRRHEPAQRVRAPEALAKLLDAGYGPAVAGADAVARRFETLVRVARALPVGTIGRSAEPEADAEEIRRWVARATGSTPALRHQRPPQLHRPGTLGRPIPLPPEVDTPEHRLLLLGTRTVPDPRVADRLRAEMRSAPPEWDLLLPTADFHGVLPLLASALEQAVPECIPVAVRERIDAARRAIAARNLGLERALGEALAVLAAAGVEARPFKGPALARSLYGNLALRPSADADVLVAPEAAATAVDALASAGYRTTLRLTRRRLQALAGKGTGLELLTPGGSPLDLQWRIVPHGWAVRLPPSALDSPAGHLVALSLHGAKHGWRRLVWLVDVAELHRAAGRPATPTVEAAAAEAGAGGPAAVAALRLGLELAAWLTGEPVPAGRLREDAVGTLLAPTGRWPSGPRLLGFALALHPPAHRLRLLADLACRTTPRDWEAVPLPDRCFPLYRAVRPVRLAATCARRLLRRP